MDERSANEAQISDKETGAAKSKGKCTIVDSVLAMSARAGVRGRHNRCRRMDGISLRGSRSWDQVAKKF